MIGLPNLRGLLLGIAALIASPSLAAPVAPNLNATGTATVTNPASLRKLNDLNFGLLTVTTAGTATINPDTEALTATGGVIVAGGLHYSAMFEAVSPVKNVVHIRIPNSPSTLTRVGGTETMTVSNFTLPGSSNRNVVAREPFEFKVGGRLNVNANQVEGLYLGTFAVEIQYP